MDNSKKFSKCEIAEELKKIIADIVNVEKEAIDFTTKLLEDLGMDSFAVAETMFLIQEKFGVTIAQEDILKVDTFNSLVETLDKILNG
ncbi:MAG: phosphopantetheine-binding protein [Candidatus Omnitrophica bacterium]|jgi:acyl carrier protein|nr:phosphopantetheine-binding protein [Candidatus Omnitrophota bacterium]